MAQRRRAPTATPAAELFYQTGFGNELASEALPGALPVGQNSPQRVAYGLYAEQISGTAFTAPRATNRRTWTYRIRPAVAHGAFRQARPGEWCTAPLEEPASPQQLRWDPFPAPAKPCDFVDGMRTLACNGSAALHTGCAVHVYCANRSMRERFFYDADGELLIVPQAGGLRIATELGVLDARPGEIALIPRGIRFRVELLSLLDAPGEAPAQSARGYVCENYGQPFRLPELGPIGANGLAHARDFAAPVAAFEDREGNFELLAKFDGALWTAAIDHSPLDVVAWRGNHAPFKYDLARFNAINSVSFDHCDPSIFTVLTAPSEIAGTANVDFVVFPPRWVVAEHTFRPPWFHRNVMSELMGLVHGSYEAKAEGFLPGGASLHNCMSGHGPDAAAFEEASKAKLVPRKIEDTLAFMFESRLVMRPTPWALRSPQLQRGYRNCWRELKKNFKAGSGRP